MSSTPNKYTPWFASNIKPYHAGSTNIYPIALLELVYHWFWTSTLHGVGPLSSHVIMISLMPSCICHVRVSKWMSSSTAPKIDSVWKFLPQWRMSSLTLELENVLSIWLESLDQEDWVMKPKTSRVMKHNLTRQGAMSPTHKRKSFSPSNYLDILLSPRSMCPSLFLCLPPPFINLKVRFH
jgi:hypothetical protein